MSAQREMLERLADGELRELLRLVGRTDVEELEVEIGGTRLFLRRRCEQPSADRQDGSLAPEATAEPPREVIKADRVGFFHFTADKSRRTPVVGERVSEGQTLGVIDALSVPNAVRAPIAGELVEILVEEGQPVEYGQPLFVVQPGE